MILDATPVVLKDGTPLTMRSPLAADAATLLTYARQLLRESHANMNAGPDGFDGVTVEQEAKLLADAAAAPSGFFLSAFAADGRIVGNLNVTAMRPAKLAHTGTIGMGSLVEFHGRGLGTALLARCIEASQANGLWRLQLQVRTFNAAGIALYERMGFTRVGTLHAHCRLEDGTYADEYLYERLGPHPATATLPRPGRGT